MAHRKVGAEKVEIRDVAHLMARAQDDLDPNSFALFLRAFVAGGYGAPHTDVEGSHAHEWYGSLVSHGTALYADGHGTRPLSRARSFTQGMAEYYEETGATNMGEFTRRIEDCLWDAIGFAKESGE